MIQEDQILQFARMLSPTIWYTSKELTAAWGVNNNKRKGLVPHFMKRNMMRRKGNTSNIQYKLRSENDWIIVMSLSEPIKPTGNGVIDAKLRKEANLPETMSSLENLISAATELGTENEILRGKLIRIQAIMEEV